MHYWVSVDDTDMPDTKGTGWLLEKICTRLEKKGLGTCASISRHQLFVHEDIPFTSHNSSMCVEIDLAADKDQDQLIAHMISALERDSQKGSDPGLCVAPKLEMEDQKRLMAFGNQAKQKICTKESAYDLARQIGIHLSEHGGTGDGVIGALAGIGLRMTGNDGRYRGWYHLGRPGDILETKEICKLARIDRLITESGRPLSSAERVVLGSEKTKTLRKDHAQVIMVTLNDTDFNREIPFRTITKKEAKKY
ncbi:MAG: hypothetical protein HUK40_19715 [Desulfobacter sp.]|nr:hypothetical protein [Desulfobacter sp.]WDP86543.1 MAG: hypothetical protein HUN05_16620 [Desulfobacter sp.]